MEDPDAPATASERAALGHPESTTEPDLDRLVLSSICAGVLAFILSATPRFVIVLILAALQPVEQHPSSTTGKIVAIREAKITAPASRLQERALEDPLSFLVLAPILETLLFLATYKLLERLGGRLFTLAPFMAVLALLSWVLHGATLMALGQAAGFAVLAFVYFRTARAHGTAWAYFATALAHMAWNSIPYAIYFIRN